MNGLDIFILGVFFASTLIGAMRGFTKELLSLFSWGGSISLSYVFLPLAQGFMHHYIANPIMAGGVAFFCTFVIFLIILSIIANIIAGYIHESSFRGIDHSLGFGFGILRGVVFISAVELGLSVFWPRQTQSATIQTARFIPMARKGGDTLLQILPNSARGWILEQAAKVESQVNSKVREHLKAGILPGGVPREGQGGSPGGFLEGHGMLEGGAGQGSASYGSGTPPVNYSFTTGQHPIQGAPQVHQQALPQVIVQQPQQGGYVQPQMVVIHPPQASQVPQLAPVSDVSGGVQPPPLPAGITQSATPRDKQLTVDELSRLKPQSSPKQESGYTRGQRDDMNRLFQAVDGE